MFLEFMCYTDGTHSTEKQSGLVYDLAIFFHRSMAWNRSDGRHGINQMEDTVIFSI